MSDNALPPMPASDAAPRHRLVVAMACIVLAGAGVAALIFVSMSPEVLAIVAASVGSFVTLAANAAGYYLGSSQGSASMRSALLDMVRR